MIQLYLQNKPWLTMTLKYYIIGPLQLHLFNYNSQFRLFYFDLLLYILQQNRALSHVLYKHALARFTIQL